MTPEGYYVLPPIVEDGLVLRPSNFQYCLLRRLLFRWATRFTSDERIQTHLVERTIDEILLEFPTAEDASQIDVELLTVMRRVALDIFRVNASSTNEQLSE